jgi:putative membrane protein
MATIQTLSEHDHRRIRLAIEAAEDRTSGEIHCVLAHSSDSYYYPAAFALSLFMVLLAPLVAAALHYFWYDMQPFYFALGHLAALLTGYAVLAALPSLRLLLTPRRLRYRRAHDNAMRQFLSRNIHRTQQRTGVLVFVSLAERYAEIIADAGINEKVGQAEWNGMVGDLVEKAGKGAIADGFILTIARAGDLLAAHFPAGAVNENELDDHLAEI